jgi:hypothetical protein
MNKSSDTKNAKCILHKIQRDKQTDVPVFLRYITNVFYLNLDVCQSRYSKKLCPASVIWILYAFVLI